jgi:hypothetical protein
VGVWLGVPAPGLAALSVAQADSIWSQHCGLHACSLCLQLHIRACDMPSSANGQCIPC